MPSDPGQSRRGRFRLNFDQATGGFSSITGRASEPVCQVGKDPRPLRWRPCGTAITSDHLLMEIHRGESEREKEQRAERAEDGENERESTEGAKPGRVQLRSRASQSLTSNGRGGRAGVARAGYHHEPHAARAAPLGPNGLLAKARLCGRSAIGRGRQAAVLIAGGRKPLGKGEYKRRFGVCSVAVRVDCGDGCGYGRARMNDRSPRPWEY